MNYKYEDYINLGIYPDIANGELQFSKGNIDFIIEKYLKILTEFYVYKQRTLAIENEYDNQFMMIKADVDYYKSQYRRCFDELKELKSLDRRYDRFEKINAGLRQECKRYKQELLKLRIETNKKTADLKSGQQKI
ncbi:MAG TPA: hypothetical protein IAC46_01035 [Candidatus Onthoplasma faecigallinarum]|nr:hypothetical protein [Candidatus Onthoplasma faecigallinarum]